ncbi:hypothetical protein SFRURICE_009131 [Spodoptera frugiperda]|uniref:SFRICE_015504 n=1 Tax=Spodoptera frugiperda TaxID=7108 RepID=A0A2H1V4R6_SPOFR|nr:hypothetical protein SFRURICE_009131 [Spodoptera frugiperda]
MQCFPKLSPKREPMDVIYESEMLPGARRLELPAPPGKEFRAPVLLAAPSMAPTHSVIQCMRPPPPPPPPPPPRLHKPPSFEEPSSSIPDLVLLINFVGINVLTFSVGKCTCHSRSDPSSKNMFLCIAFSRFIKIRS